MNSMKSRRLIFTFLSRCCHNLIIFCAVRSMACVCAGTSLLPLRHEVFRTRLRALCSQSLIDWARFISLCLQFLFRCYHTYMVAWLLTLVLSKTCVRWNALRYSSAKRHARICTLLRYHELFQLKFIEN